MSNRALLTSHLTTNLEALIELTDSPATRNVSRFDRPTNKRPFDSVVDHKQDRRSLAAVTLLVSLIALVTSCSSCSSILDSEREARPLVMRDVPAQRLAYRLEPDVPAAADSASEETNDKIEAIQLDFSTRRENDALLKTVRSPDGQRALALYGTENEPSQTFRIDLYSSDGNFLRNVTPPDLSCVFPETVSWSSDGNSITFIAHKSVKPTPTPTPPGASPPEVETGGASSLPSVAPAFAPVQVFNTEQIYICNRDGYDLKPLSSREGLIYFYSAWSPDNQSVVALACRESEWEAREREYKLPTGRPRLITLDGKERLLDDDLTEALPVWSPDASKVATAFDTEVRIYDAAGDKPTQARIRLHDALLTASRVFEEKTSSESKKGDNQPAGSGTAASAIPASFNPVVGLEWSSPEHLYLRTAYVRLIPNEPINTFQRWHLLTLSPQAALLR